MQNEAKNQEVFKELFASKTTAKSTLHAPFRLHRNALPLDLQLVLRKLRKRNNYHLVFRTNNLFIKRHCDPEFSGEAICQIGTPINKIASSLYSPQ